VAPIIGWLAITEEAAMFISHDGRRVVPALAALLVLLLAACGQAGSGATATAGSSAASSPAASAATSGGASEAASQGGGCDNEPLACDVVTTEMIQQGLGTTVAAGISTVSELGGSTCEFKDAGIFVRVFPSRDAAFLESMKGSFAGAVDLPGVGDGAFYSSENATFMVLKGTTVVQVQAPNQNDQAKLAALAAAIAAKL
jgi:hypothetical protein